MNPSSQIAMIVYPGSNCDKDCEKVFLEEFNIQVLKIWHQEKNLPKVGGVILPGGFSYGDYLRSGSLASMSAIMPAIIAHAQRGGSILGICNGFQILTESALLPGTLLPNVSHKFICKDVSLTPQKTNTVWNTCLGTDTVKIPIAHKEGRYYLDDTSLETLKERNQVLLRYKDHNPNGSSYDIAGVCSQDGKIMGMMPHPERVCLKGRHKAPDGKKILESFLAHSL